MSSYLLEQCPHFDKRKRHPPTWVGPSLDDDDTVEQAATLTANNVFLISINSAIFQLCQYKTEESDNIKRPPQQLMNSSTDMTRHSIVPHSSPLTAIHRKDLMKLFNSRNRERNETCLASSTASSSSLGEMYAP